VLDNSRYYLLGYYSDSRHWSGKFLTIDVRVKRPGLRVRARQGYLPPERTMKGGSKGDEKTPPALAAALRKPLPVGDLSLRVFAAPFRSTGRNVSVLVALEIDGDSLRFDNIEGRFNNRLDVSIVATDQHARVQGGDRQTFNLRLLPETYWSIRRTGVRLLSRIDVPPGRYQIRVGAHETSGRTAMVPYDLEIPDYSGMPFSMSGVVLTSSDAESFVTANRDDRSMKVLSTPPVATRRFTGAEMLTSFVEVYDNRRAMTGEIVLEVRVEDARTGHAVFTARDRSAAEVGGAKAYGFQTVIPMKHCPPGIYVLRVQAMSTSGQPLAEREVPFEVIAGRVPTGNLERP
jgi:hypothetical protein